MSFSTIQPAPPDAILGLTEAFKKDSNPDKVNLGVGVYQNEDGVTATLDCVRQAEQKILQSAGSKSYMPISGSPEYGRVVQALLFGENSELVEEGRVVTAHTPGGTGGLRVGGDFLRSQFPNSSIWVSTPTWANHQGVFRAAGLPIQSYPYYDPQTKGLDFDAMLHALKQVPGGDIVLLHVCCHNPTGVDLNAQQWQALAECALTQGWIPFLDFAYQGFGQGLEEDRVGLNILVDAGLDLLVASSFSKNFGLYCERTGALSLVTATVEEAQACFSQVKSVIRTNYSNPPAHGGRIVSTILTDTELTDLWKRELDAMRERILSVRKDFVAGLQARGVDQDFSFIEDQQGMFSFSGLSDEQVLRLREEKSIYIVKGGRINVAGITPKNSAYLCDAIAEVLGV